MSLSICVLAAQRTGTNLLMSQFPSAAFKDLGEVFHSRQLREGAFQAAGLDIDTVRALRDEDPGRFLDDCVAAVGQRTDRHVLWKVQYPHVFRPLEAQRRRASALRERPGIPIIHLVRKDLVARYVSVKVAEVSGQYLLTPSKPRIDVGPIVVDVDECLANLRRTRLLMRRAERAFARPRLVRVTYEDLVARPADVSATLTTALGISVSLAAPATVKQGRPLTESVFNYDELASALEGTRWELA